MTINPFTGEEIVDNHKGGHGKKGKSGGGGLAGQGKGAGAAKGLSDYSGGDTPEKQAARLAKVAKSSGYSEADLKEVADDINRVKPKTTPWTADQHRIYKDNFPGRARSRKDMNRDIERDKEFQAFKAAGGKIPADAPKPGKVKIDMSTTAALADNIIGQAEMLAQKHRVPGAKAAIAKMKSQKFGNYGGMVSTFKSTFKDHVEFTGDAT